MNSQEIIEDLRKRIKALEQELAEARATINADPWDKTPDEVEVVARVKFASDTMGCDASYDECAAKSHSGDCTGEPYTCDLCLVEDALAFADAALTALHRAGFRISRSVEGEP